MKKLIILAAFLVCVGFSTNAHAAITRVQFASTSFSGAGVLTSTVVWPANLTNNNVAICWLGVANTSTVFTNYSGTGQTWHNGLIYTGNQYLALGYGEIGAGASTSTLVTLSNSPVIPRVNCEEYSGLATSSEYDSSATAGNGGTATTTVTATVTPQAGRSALLIALMRTAGSVVSGPTNGFTALTTVNGGFPWGDLATTTSGSYSSGYVVSVQNTWGTMIATFYAPAAAASIASGTLTLTGGICTVSGSTITIKG